MHVVYVHNHVDIYFNKLITVLITVYTGIIHVPFTDTDSIHFSPLQRVFLAIYPVGMFDLIFYIAFK